MSGGSFGGDFGSGGAGFKSNFDGGFGGSGIFPQKMLSFSSHDCLKKRDSVPGRDFLPCVSRYRSYGGFYCLWTELIDCVSTHEAI